MQFSWPTFLTLLISSGLAPYLASHNFTLTADQQGWLVAATIAGFTGAAHWLHSLKGQNPPLPPPVVKAVALFVLGALLTLGMAVGLPGCKTAPSVQQQSAISVAVDLATGLAVQQGSNDPAVWKASATAFKQIATTLQTINNSGTATLATLAADLQPLIAKLGPADVLAANALVAALTPYLQQQISANPTVANTQTAIGYILADVVQACAAYGA